jgi:hypothetical protein
MADRILSDLFGTLKSTFRIAGIYLVSVAADTVLDVKNKAGTVFRGVRALTFRARSTGSGDVVIGVNGSVASDIAFNLPNALGSTGNVLRTDGSGNLTWVSVATASNQVLAQQETVQFNSAGTVLLFTPPDNATIRSVIVEVETAFNATGCAITIGDSNNLARHVGSTDVDLATVGVYEVVPMYEVGTGPVAVNAYFTAGTSGTTGVARVTVEYSNPG